MPSIVSGIVFGLLGFSGNWFRLELFFNVDFLFGSFFVVFALLRFGPAAGVVAGILAAACTWILWNHPWAIVVFGSEVLFLAWRMRKPGRDLLTADVLFWIVIGAPLVWFFYHEIMGISLQLTTLIILKQALNGLINTLLATLAYLLLCAWRRRHENLPSFHQLVFLSFVSLVMLPAMGYLIWDLHRELKRGKDDLVTTVNRLSNTASQLVRQRLEEQVRTVQTLAWLADDPQQADPERLQRQVDMIRSASPTMSRMAVFNQHAVVLARSPRLDEEGKSTIGSDVSGGLYLAELLDKKRPLVTDIFLGRLGKPVPLVAIVVPILHDTVMTGYCTGIIDQSSLQETFDTIINHRLLHFTLLDRDHRVVISTRNDLPKMALYTRSAGMAGEESKGVYHWVPDPEKGISFVQRWRTSYFFKERQISQEFPLTVIVEASAAPMMEFLTRETNDTLLRMLLLTLATIGLSHLLSRRFIQTIQALEFASHKLPERLREQEQVAWPRSGIRELDNLSCNFEQMSSALGTSFSSLHTLNETLERRVAERTEELSRSEERFRTLFERHQAIMLLVNPTTGDILNANQAAADFYGYDRPLLRQMQLAQLRTSAANVFPAEPVNHYTVAHRVATGEGRIMEVYSSILELDGQKILFAILHDVTERQRMEEELRHSKLDWERTFDAVPDLICTLDSHGRILRMNRAMAERLQVNKESAIGQRCFACVHGSPGPHEFCPLIQTTADLRPHSAEIIEDKMSGIFHITTTPVFDPDGQYFGTVHVARDISEEKKLQEQLQYLSLHDELTGLFNRRALDRAADREWRRATRLPQPFSALLLDIDHFKRYNDAWGHLQGDECLKVVAAVIQHSVFRAEDFIARYGGEEFIVILPMTTTEDAAQIAERIRLAVAAQEILHPDGTTRSQVTISIGVATTIPVKDTAPTILFQMADQALYAAKSAGRNCIVLHLDNTPA